MKRSLTLLVPAFALLLGAGARARADQVQWTYNWDRSPVSVLSDSGNGSVLFTNEPTKQAVGSSDTVATNLKASSLAASSHPDTLTSSGAYKLTLTLTDTTSGQSGVLSFLGKLSGTFSKDNANITNAFTGALTGTLTLGKNTYTVTIGPYSPPGPPSASNFGSIAAHVDVQPGVVVAKTPEPTSLVLGCVGLSLAGVSSWRKRRAARAAA